MTGWRATLDSSTVLCKIEKAPLDMSFIYPFVFVEWNAVSVMNLNYSTGLKHLTLKIVKNGCQVCSHPVQLQKFLKQF